MIAQQLERILATRLQAQGSKLLPSEPR